MTLMNWLIKTIRHLLKIKSPSRFAWGIERNYQLQIACILENYYPFNHREIFEVIMYTNSIDGTIRLMEYSMVHGLVNIDVGHYNEFSFQRQLKLEKLHTKTKKMYEEFLR